MSAKSSEPTKETFLRLPITMRAELVKEAAKESVERNENISVQRVIIGILEEWLNAKKT